MDAKQLTSALMKHEGRIGKVEQKVDGLEKLHNKHVNRHFQLTCIAFAQLIVLIGGLIVLFVKLSA